MSREGLSPFSYVVLALVGRGGAGPHDLVRMMRTGRVYWAAAESHFYAEPKRLERLGYLRSEKRPGKTRERTHYHLTEKGEQALRGWLATPAPFPRIQHEAVIRLLAGDLVDDAAIVNSLEGLRAEIADLSARLGLAEETATTLPHRQRYLRLVHSLGRKLLRVHEEWADEVECELAIQQDDPTQAAVAKAREA
jgi:PadR family transcriptional regulator, regulatory protein AphA